MFSRIGGVRAVSRVARRFQSQASSASHETPFNNKFNFNVSPPPIHLYWNASNSSALFAFVPLFFAIGYTAKYIGANVYDFEALKDFADLESSPLKDLKYGEPQQRK